MEHEKGPSSSAQKPSGLLGLLGTLFFFLGALLFSKATPIEKSIYSNETQSETDQQRNQTKGEHREVIASKSNSPPPVENKDKAYRYAEEAREWGLLVIEALGLIGLAVYACTTYKMWHEMQAQTCIQRQSAEASERAWIGLDGAPQVIVSSLVPNNFQATILATLRNFGKGPALKVMFDTRIVTANVAGNLQSSCNLIFPFVGLKPAWQVGFSDSSVLDRHWGQIVFPGQPYPIGGNYGGGNTVNPIGKEAFVIGCIAYQDQFGNPHWTKFSYDTGPFTNQVVRNADSFKRLYISNANNYTDDEEKKQGCPVTAVR